MATQPDMILAFAHHLAREERDRGRDVAVFADAWVVLNGRPAQRLVVQHPLEIGELAFGPAALDPAVDQRRDPGAVVPAVLQALQRIEQKGRSRLPAENANDAAHRNRSPKKATSWTIAAPAAARRRRADRSAGRGRRSGCRAARRG